MDVHLTQTPDGGDIQLDNGAIVMSDGIETAVELSLFGGNENDRGIEADDPEQWWGNWDEQDPARRYRSELQAIIRGMPATPANLRRLRAATERDLAWFVDGGIAQSVSVTARIPRINWVNIGVVIRLSGGAQVTLTFEREWL